MTVVDMDKDIDLYNDTLEQLKAINTQLKSPGDYVSSRLESVSLDDTRRELKSLQASCHSQASGLIKSLFSNAEPFNETIESTISSIVPLKDVLEESLRELEDARNTIKSTHRDVKLRLCRYAMIMYTKVAIATHIEADKQVDNIAEEIVDSFKVYNKNEPIKKYTSPVDKATLMIETIAKYAEKHPETMKVKRGKYNLVTNWSLLELAQKEINRVNRLIMYCRRYENTLTQYVQEYAEILQQMSPELSKSMLNLVHDSRKTNVEKVLIIEKLMDCADAEQFNEEYSLNNISERANKLHGSLIELTQICAHGAMKVLFELYTELHKLESDTESDSAVVENVRCEIETYISGLGSLINGGEQLDKYPNDAAGDKGHMMKSLVSIFIKTFVKPIINSKINVLTQQEGRFMTSLSPREEFSMFTKFVDLAIVHLLHPKSSITMKMLNDVSRVCKNSRFKVVCVFDAIALELLNHVEKKFSSIYFAIYMDQFMSNCRAYERLIENIEIATGNYSHYLKWRGSSAPYNSSKCFSVGVVCDNFIEDVTSQLIADISANGDVSGNVLASKDKEFYASPTRVLYDMLYELFHHEYFFYHLIPQYLRGVAEMFKEYLEYVKSLVNAMERANGTDSRETETSGASVTYATYILHDLDIIVHALRTGTVCDLEIGTRQRPSKINELDYGCSLINDFRGTCHVECSPSRSEVSSSSTETGETSSTDVSGVYPTASSNDEGNESAPNDVVNASGDKDASNIIVDIRSKRDGEIVKMAIKRLDYPLQVAFRRIVHTMAGDSEMKGGIALVQGAVQVLDGFWKRAINMDRGSIEMEPKHDKVNIASKTIPQAEGDDVKKLVVFAKTSIAKMYNFFSSIHEQLEAVRYGVEDYIIRSLFVSASCSLQFLQSMPSKFRTGNKQDTVKPSNYVKFLVVPLTSFREFTAPTLSEEMARKIMTQTISRLSSEYRLQALKLVHAVKNLNHTLLTSKNQKVKEHGENFLTADIGKIKEQLATDITEFVNQCESRLEVKYQLCEDLKRLKNCLTEELTI